MIQMLAIETSRLIHSPIVAAEMMYAKLIHE